MRDELFEFVVTELQTRKGQWTQLAADTGVSTKTMQRIVERRNSNRRNTLLALADHFKTNPAHQSAPSPAASGAAPAP